MSAPTGRKVMIAAGEASGDMHGAHLVRSMRGLAPELGFSGMGGPELSRAGMEQLVDASCMAVVGAAEVLGHLGAILDARSRLIRHMETARPDLLILIDYPDFNLLLARRAKKLGIPVFYYISPQIWAWRTGRVRTIRRLVDRMAVILPFEQDFYSQHGMRVDFVGHPLLDSVRPEITAAAYRESLALPPDRPLIGLLPGSRRKEISALLPALLGAAALLDQAVPGGCTFLIPQAPTISRGLLDRHGLLAWRGRLDYRVISGDRFSMMAACDLALAASGTVLLELAILGVPTVATYRMAQYTYLLGRLLVRKVRFFSLVNLIAGRAIIPELLQHEVTPRQILRAARPLLAQGPEREAMLAGMREVRERLGQPGASQRAAALALETLESRGR
ncbi:MAG: lipid-A-disaccharide synthase [Desulfobulbus sp.]|jgi:lipid-A-disaccharide synthase